MTDSSSYAFAGCMDVVNFLLLHQGFLKHMATPHQCPKLPNFFSRELLS